MAQYEPRSWTFEVEGEVDDPSMIGDAFDKLKELIDQKVSEAESSFKKEKDTPKNQ